MTNSTPEFSIIIPTATNADGFVKCVESIVQFTDLSDVELVVVANGAPESTKTCALQLPMNVTLLWFDEMIGFTRAVNEAFKVAKGQFLILLNDDCELLGQPKNSWLERLYTPFTDEQVALTGPLYDRCPSTDRDFFLFFCVMIRRAALDALGGQLDEIYNPGAGEDCAFCHDAEDAGWKLVAVGGEPVWADRGDESLLPHQRGQWVTTFPLWHKAGCTVSYVEGFQETFNRNAEILRKRYGVTIERARSIEGWMADSELAWLARQARKSSVVVEVGSWCGRSSRAIADNLLADAVLYCIDTYNGSSGEPDAHITAKEREGDGVYMKFFANLYDHIRLGRVIPVRMESGNAAETLRNMGVVADWLFVDGDHSTEGFRRDVNLWQPLVKDGGLLSGHDYYLPEQNPMAWIGVRTVVNEMFPDAQQAPDTSIWHVRKKDTREQFHAALDQQNMPRIGYPASQSAVGYDGFFGALWREVDQRA